jgi:hypothetical protein
MGGSMGKLIFLNCFLTRTPVFIRFFFGDLHRPTVA